MERLVIMVLKRTAATFPGPVRWQQGETASTRLQRVGDLGPERAEEVRRTGRQERGDHDRDECDDHRVLHRGLPLLIAKRDGIGQPDIKTSHAGFTSLLLLCRD